jgi:hypothetical protein
MPELQLVCNALSSAPQLSSLGVFSGARSDGLQVDALPLRELESLEWECGTDFSGGSSFSVEQLQIIKQLAPLQRLDCHYGDWSAEEVQFLCAQPNFLHQLSEMTILGTEIDRITLSALSCPP